MDSTVASQEEGRGVESKGLSVLSVQVICPKTCMFRSVGGSKLTLSVSESGWVSGRHYNAVWCLQMNERMNVSTIRL